MLEGQSNFLSRFVRSYDGKLLADPSQSPENSGPETKGTTFDQQEIYENHRNTLAAAKVLGIGTDDNPRLAVYAEQLPKFDPIIVGTSGQIKEYREETSYGSIGDLKHRHISQLLGLYRPADQRLDAGLAGCLEGNVAGPRPGRHHRVGGRRTRCHLGPCL